MIKTKQKNNRQDLKFCLFAFLNFQRLNSAALGENFLYAKQSGDITAQNILPFLVAERQGT